MATRATHIARPHVIGLIISLGVACAAEVAAAPTISSASSQAFYTGDIDDQTRSDAWDIGADEARSGWDLAAPKLLIWQEIAPN